MNQTPGIVLVVLGICFMILGMQATHTYIPGALGAGAFQEKLVLYFLSGTIATVVGVYLLASRAQ